MHDAAASWDSFGLVSVSRRTVATALCAVSLALSACGGESSSPRATLSDASRPDQTALQTNPGSPATTQRPTTAKANHKPPDSVLTASTRAEFDTVLRSSGASDGAIAVQALDGTKPTEVGELKSPYAWSSIKPVIVAALLRASGGPDGLSDQQQTQARAALTASDNDAAMALFGSLASRRGGVKAAASDMTDLLRGSGDSATEVSSVGRDGFSPYGQTLWAPKAQTRFVTALARGCLLDRPSTAYLLGVMNEVVPDQRWGFGTLSAVSALKGGWGPDPDGRYLVRQIGLMETRTGEPVAFAAAVRPGDGTFDGGIRALNVLANWLQGAGLRAAMPKDC